MAKKKITSPNKKHTVENQGWLPDKLMPYLRDSPEISELLQRFESFTPHDWHADDLIEWVATTLRTSLANTVLSDKGYEKAKEKFSKRRIPIEDWALSRPGWWDTFEKWRERNLKDYFTYEPPEIAPDELPLELESWWRLYIKEPVEPNPRRRCAYLVAAKLLKKDFPANALVRFAAKQRQKPSPDTTYAEWELTDEGNKYIIGLNKRTVKRSNKEPAGPSKLAQKLEINCWEGLHLELHDSLIRAHEVGGEKAFKDISFQEFGLGKGKGKYPNNSLRLLMFLAYKPNKYDPEYDDFYAKHGQNGMERFKQDLFRLNKRLIEIFGLNGNPISRSRKVADRGIVKNLFRLSIAEDEKETKDRKGKPADIVKPDKIGRKTVETLSPEEMESKLMPYYKMKGSID